MTDHDFTRTPHRWANRLFAASFVVGGVVPLLIAQFADIRFDPGVAGGIFTSSAAATLSLLKLLSVRLPRSAVERIAASPVLASTGAFASVFAAMATAILLAALPVPRWAHIAMGVVLAALALTLLMRSHRS